MAKLDTKRGEYILKLENTVNDKGEVVKVGEEIKCLFNMRFWMYLEEEGYKLETLETYLGGKEGVMAQLKCIAAVIISAGHAYDNRHDVNFRYTVDDAIEWLEEDVTQDKLEDLLTAMMATKIFGNEINKSIDRKGKQKAPKRS